MLWKSPIAKLAVCFIAGAAVVVGQQSPVTVCIEPYEWAINTKNQTPCLVAAFLESACGPPVTIPALPINNHYQGPTSTQQNECLCSSVTYSVVSACAGCQGRSFQNWTTWSENCISSVLTTFPLSLPIAVEVPSWAFLNVSLSNNTFNPVLAQATLSGVNPSSSSSSMASTTFSSASSAPESTSPAPITTDSKKSNHAGAIAGGVVGGLVFLAIVGLGALWWAMRKKRNAAPVDDLTFDRRALVGGTITSQPTGSTSRSPEGQSTGPYSSPLYGTSTDMSMVPTSPVTSAVYTTVPASRRSLESVSHSLAHFGGLHAAQNRQPLGYSGAAEV